MNLRTLFIAVALAVACLGGTATAASRDVPPALSDYRITSWTGGDGIILGEVRSIAQDEDGYLWLGCEVGLVRFDGFHFATSGLVSGATPLPAAPTRAVFKAHDGSLWAGFAAGQGVYHIVHGEVHGVYLKNQITGFVNVITEDHTGAIWVGHDEGLVRLRDGRWEQMLSFTTSGRVVDVHEDRAGTLWVAAASGLYRRNPAGAFERAPQSEGITLGISEDADGRMWATDQTRGFRRADAPDHQHLFDAQGMNVFHDRRGNLWVATIGHGLWQVRNAGGDGTAPTVRRATVQTGLVSDENSDILEDRDGNIWVATIRGLNRLTPYKVTSLVDIGIVRALALGADGNAWAGTTSGLIALAGVTTRTPGRSTVISGTPIRTLHRAADGTVWAATDEGLQRVVAHHLVPVRLGGPMLRRITSIVSNRHGALWLCDEVEGVLRLVDGRLEHVAAATDGTTSRPIFAHIDSADRLWIAFEGGTVRSLDRDGGIKQYGPAEGLPSTTLYTIHDDRAGTIWIGGSGGLSHLRGDRFETLTERNGLPERPITAIVDDDAGDLWAGVSAVGFLRIGHKEIERAMTDPSHRLRYRVYNTSDGTASPNRIYGNNASRGPDGALWFVTSRGVTVLDPRELRHEPGAALGPPRLEGVTVDDRRYAATSGVVLPPRTSRLRIDYTVVSLSSLDRIQFRYRLDGFDRDWVDGTGPRQALYTNLPPGAYRFRLQASSNAATWSDAVTDWSFSIQPMFYQTRWFYSLCAVGLVLCAMGAWRLRMRQVRKEFAAVFGERIRLSREIHDTLLQSLVGIALQLDSVSHDLRDTSSRARAQLVGMRRQVEDYIREVRQSIWDLRSPALDRHGLIDALRTTGDRLTAGKVRFALTVTGTPRPCPPRVETQVLRIGHEAVMNAVRHAEARHVLMEIGFDDRILRLRVADDGRGFNAEQALAANADQHYGLISMHERAADAGGRCTIESTPGSGVQVVVEFPLAPAA